jgi:O-acetylhomoserine (thiol)-lyase
VPIYQTTSYAFDDTQHGADLFDLKVPGNIYTRIMNPTTDVLEKRVAELEGGIAAWPGLRHGGHHLRDPDHRRSRRQHRLGSSTLYGGTYNLFAHTLPQFGIEVRFADYRKPESFAKLIDAPHQGDLLRIDRQPAGQRHDFGALAEIAHDATACR